jgi:hypothetical protein
MKAALNGVPSLSVLDGSWIEGYIEGVTGWAIGKPGPVIGQPSSRQNDAASLYEKLERAVIPHLLSRPRPVRGNDAPLHRSQWLILQHSPHDPTIHSQSPFLAEFWSSQLNNHPPHEMDCHELTTNKPSHQAAHDCPMGVGNSRRGGSCATHQLRHDRCSQKTGSPRLSSMQDGQSRECFQPARRTLSRLPQSRFGGNYAGTTCEHRCEGCQGTLITFFREGKFQHKCSICKETPFTCPVIYPNTARL